MGESPVSVDGVVLVELGPVRRFPGGQAVIQGSPVDPRLAGQVVAFGQTPPELFDARLEDMQLDMSAGGTADGQELVTLAAGPRPELDDHPPVEGQQLGGERVLLRQISKVLTCWQGRRSRGWTQARLRACLVGGCRGVAGTGGGSEQRQCLRRNRSLAAAARNPRSRGTRRTTGSVPPAFNVDRGATSSLTRGLTTRVSLAADLLPNGSTTT